MLGSIIRALPVGFGVILCPLLVLAGAAQESEDRLRPTPCAELARTAVREALALENAPLGDLRVKVLAEVTQPAKQAVPHSKIPAKQEDATAPWLPQFVQVAAYKGNEIFGLYLVRLGNGHPSVRRISDFSYGRPVLLTDAEYVRLENELSSFYEAALDVTRGPDRFLPFMAKNPADYLESETLFGARMSNLHLRQLFAYWFDYTAHAAWATAEGVPIPRVSRWHIRSEKRVQEIARKLEADVSSMKEGLLQRGALESRHVATAIPYVRRLYGEGLLAKRVYSDTDTGIPGMAPGTVLYIILVPGGSGADLNLYFARLDGGLRFVTLTFGD